MADPKGPETGERATGGPGARPRATLDLSATDVTSKPAGAATGKAPETAPEAGEPEPAAASPGSPPSGAPSAAASSPAAPSPVTPPPGGDAAKAAAKPDTAPDAKPAAPTPGSDAAKPAGTAPRPSAAIPASGAPGASSSTSPGASSASAASAAGSAAKTTAGSGPQASSDRMRAAESSSAAPKPPAKPEPEPASGGFGILGLLAAAIGGAAIAVVVVSVFGTSLISAPEPDMTRVTAVETRLDGVGRDLDGVGRDVAALRGAVGKSPETSDTGAIEGRIAELGRTIEASDGRIGSVETELKGLSEKVAQPVAAPPAIDMDALGMVANRIEALEHRMQTVPTIDTIAALSGRVDETDAQAKDAPTKDQVAAIEQKVGGVGPAIEKSLKPLGERVAAVESALKARPVGDPAARQVVALGALGQALDAGRAFVAELSAVQASSQNGELSGLAPFAQAGVPTRATLAAELAGILAGLPAEKAGENASVFSRFVANAGGLVKVTPKETGSSATSDPRARLVALAAAGDIDQAVAAREAADDAAKAATADWAKQATARVAADKALDGARTAALARLGAGE